MMQFSMDQLITTIALPTVSILLIWTIVIFHKNRKKWGPYDIPIVCILILSVMRNLGVLSYVLVNSLSDPRTFSFEYCSVVVWIFNSIHTFQASSLTTVAVIGLFSLKLHKKRRNLRSCLTSTHVVYHVFCLTTLCACVGVAAVLAQHGLSPRLIQRAVFECKFMPFDLDVKFNIFILALHMFLSVVSFASFLIVCYKSCQSEADFKYVKKSNSDISDFSLENTLSKDNKDFYDACTLQRGANDGNQFGHGDYCGNWNSDLSNTVSSVNSKRPCLEESIRETRDDEYSRTGLETIHPILIVCYLFYHLPIIVLCIYPDLIFPWRITDIALWLGIVQDILMPVGLGIVDSRFCKWVSSVYRCNSAVEDKLPHAGLAGKFRPFSLGSQPQSLEIQNTEGNHPIFQSVEHRFPITNGSLYTSIDGRLPVIHNYRRNNKDNRKCSKPDKNQSFHGALSHHRHDHFDVPTKFPSCSTCKTDLCPSHSNLHHLSTSYINKQLNQQLNQLNQFNCQLKSDAALNSPALHFNLLNQKSMVDRIVHSQESLHAAPNVEQDRVFQRNFDFKLNSQAVKNSRNIMRMNQMRLSRSEDSLNELHAKEKVDNAKYSPRCKPIVPRVKVQETMSNDQYSSDDEYNTDLNNEHFDSMSSKSCYSITTEANCDFDFFQSDSNRRDIVDDQGYYIINNVNNKPVITSVKPVLEKDNVKEELRNFRIRRSNSKRSLENFQAFVEEEENMKNKSNGKFGLQRSNSYVTLEDKRAKAFNDKYFRSSCKETTASPQIHVYRQRVKSEEYLPNTTTVYIEDAGLSCFGGNCTDECGVKCVHSIPDLKKVFISEYI
ncbi:unnamed protein product [Phyllotreta striolata]|uniref:G-protein coupled receptors family 1 profile domain-containing protein n=1 Tax=Phyllotreta striolata TaxID=444603 RepID=A0A9N9XNF2_PHYSR|nr:unnamed protein product [Phyllotreta striolata]